MPAPHELHRSFAAKNADQDDKSFGKSKEESMSAKVNPEAMEPTTYQSFDESPRNPAVGEWGEGGGGIPSPAASEARS